MKIIVPALSLLLLLSTPPTTPDPPPLDEPETSSGGRATSGLDPTFCLDGPVMSQLLQGFGCPELADRVEDSRLNCETRILREEIVDGRAILDLVIQCECESSQAGGVPLERLGGTWRVIVDL